ncbi:MAG: hypothetical protein LBD75_06280 [Candidatus Peribacteria bacterium]|nr:hypothetical protein [Candidatus Peribacteria bacterium]
MQALPRIIKSIPTFKAMLIVSESPNNTAEDVKAFITRHHLSKHIIRIPGVKYSQL